MDSQFDKDYYDRFVAGHDDSDKGECEICGNIYLLTDGEEHQDKSDGHKFFVCNNCIAEYERTEREQKPMKLEFDLKILSHQYTNTGGHCMVGTTMVYNRKDNRTYFIHVNEEGGSISTADHICEDIEYADNMMLEYIRWDDPSIENLPHLDAYRTAYIQYIIKDCKDGTTYHLPWLLLDEELRAQVLPGYQNWVNDNLQGMFETNGNKIYIDDNYDPPKPEPMPPVEVEEGCDAWYAQKLLKHMQEAFNKGMSAENDKNDDAANEFYCKEFVFGFDGQFAVFSVSAATYSGFEDALKYIIEQY